MPVVRVTTQELQDQLEDLVEALDKGEYDRIEVVEDDAIVAVMLSYATWERLEALRNQLTEFVS